MERERSTNIERGLPIPRSDERRFDREVPLAAGQLSAEEALEIAVDAYVYAYPLVLMDVTRAVSTNTVRVDGARLRAPVNQFAHARAFPDATFTDVVRANADTLYSTLWFDVSKEPLIITVLDSGGRYYLLPLLDLWTDVFASPGKRTTGTGAQRFAIVGPQWSGTLPTGIDTIRAPTSLGWLIGRTQTNGPPDYAAVHAFQSGLRATPLSAFGRPYAPPPGRTSSTTVGTPPVEQVDAMSAAAFFGRFAALTGANPPHSNDYPLLQRVRRLGVVPGGPFVHDRLSRTAVTALDRAIPIARQKIHEYAGRSARRVNGWSMGGNPIGTYGTDYLKRALIARMGLGANTVEDAIYPAALGLADGTPFDSGARYELRFASNELPPARAFWSLAMYNDRQFFAPNPIGRYAIGDRDPLQFGADGSLTLHIQRVSPGTERESNWLPAPPSGAFTMNLRIYWPEARALDGRWAPPPVKRIG
jgi:hypothetical protein